MIGIGEDGLSGLNDASRNALERAEIVFGGARHLELAQVGARGVPWGVPFSVDPVLAARGRRVAVLASGDPFWHGVGGSLATVLSPSDWRCFPAPSCVSLAAARMGWRLETCTVVGLHAAAFETLRPHLANGARLIVTLRDGDAPAALAAWLDDVGFGRSRVTAMAGLGGPNEVIRRGDLTGLHAPVLAAIEAHGTGLSQTPGRAIDLFAHDGQITKPPMRALTLAALAPRAGETLWDLGAGSGSISVEWLLAAPNSRAIAVEPRADRIENIHENARRFGLTPRLNVLQGRVPDLLPDSAPDAVFIGGGLSAPLLGALWKRIAPGTRVVANAVTIASQSLLADWHARHGGHLLRIDLAEAEPLGRMQGWAHSRPQLQWSTTR